ncbi:MAG TPA: phenylalanine--tRNA ligase subunit beta [Vicinamibacterales bacterium]|nr:phenylalanine--tRNA ligase subunit beta [Vicinamibacterales bacterium]
MKVPLSWVREFVDVTPSAEEIGTLMGVRGLPLEGLTTHGDDLVMDFEVHANRPDLLSMIGIAREIATAYRSPWRPREVASWNPDQSIPITIDEPDLCGRYVGATAEVTVGPSPKWMQDRLLACGIRPISNIVDITNYVMLELGQPMHAFDLDKMLEGKVVVRRAKRGETMTTLDGKKRTLTPDMLVIADAKNAEDIGGVMGGANSEIAPSTKRVVFEAAYFAPGHIRTTSKALGLKTEASTRFERGMDRTAPPRAMMRALELLEKIGAGKPTGHITDVYPRPDKPKTLKFERARIAGLLGMDVPDDEINRILVSLGFSKSPDWNITVPSWRVDINRQVDLIEEVGRHYGFEHLPTTFPGVEQAPPPSDARIARDRRFRTALLAMGLSEAITFAFIEAAAAEPYLAGTAPITIANPLSEKFVVMRPSLLPGLVDAVSHNRRHGRPDVRLFEIGTRFSPHGETRGAAFAWTGLATPDHWSGARRAVDFADAKGVIEQICAIAHVPPQFHEAETPYLVSGRAAMLIVNDRAIGVFGQLAPAVAEARELPADEVYVGEIDLDALTAAAPAETLRTAALPRYPSVVRDVSILVDDALSAATVRGTIRAAAPDTLIQIREFDRYQGKGVPEGKVSLSFRLTFQSPDRTLTDEEVQAAMQNIITALTRDLDAVQR